MTSSGDITIFVENKFRVVYYAAYAQDIFQENTLNGVLSFAIKPENQALVYGFPGLDTFLFLVVVLIIHLFCWSEQ